MPKQLYLASPLGFSEAGRYFMYDILIPAIQEVGFGIIDPWKLTSDNLIQTALNAENKKEAWKTINPIIGENNAKGIEQSNGLVAILDGVDVDSGTASEIGFAFAKEKKILGYRGDFRLSADNEGSTVNLQVEYFIRRSGGNIITKTDELKQELLNIFGNPF